MDLGLPAELSQVISYQASRFSECQELVHSCAPTKSSCAAIVCAQCATFGSVLKSCCSQGPAPTACFVDYLATKSSDGSGGSVITSAPVLSSSAIVDPNELACNTLSTYINSCENATPDFDSLTLFADQAPCLCYNQQSWQPQAYDGVWASCLQYISTALPDDYASAVSSNGGLLVVTPCADVGNVLLPTSAMPPSTSSMAQVAASVSRTTVIATSTSMVLGTGGMSASGSASTTAITGSSGSGSAPASTTPASSTLTHAAGSPDSGLTYAALILGVAGIAAAIALL